MGYRLKPGKPLADEVRRIAREQIESVLEAAPASGGSVRWVHETRKSVKRLRALLRLVRDGLERPDWLALNTALRDSGRLLAPLRDRAVLEVSLRHLEAGADPALLSAISKLEQALSKLQAAKSGQGAPARRAPEIVRRTCVGLQAVHLQLDRMTLVGDDAAVIESGLARNRRSARRALRRAHDAPSDETLHELRKAVQVHWRQMQLLEKAWPGHFRARIERARQLAQHLGEDHDLAVLARRVAALGAEQGLADAAACLDRACRHYQHRLRKSALLEADLLFTARARPFAAEVGRYWQIAGMESRNLGSEPPTHDVEAAPLRRGSVAAARAKSGVAAKEGAGAPRAVRARKTTKRG